MNAPSTLLEWHMERLVLQWHIQRLAYVTEDRVFHDAAAEAFHYEMSIFDSRRRDGSTIELIPKERLALAAGATEAWNWAGQTAPKPPARDRGTIRSRGQAKL